MCQGSGYRHHMSRSAHQSPASLLRVQSDTLKHKRVSLITERVYIPLYG